MSLKISEQKTEEGYHKVFYKEDYIGRTAKDNLKILFLDFDDSYPRIPTHRNIIWLYTLIMGRNISSFRDLNLEKIFITSNKLEFKNFYLFRIEHLEIDIINNAIKLDCKKFLVDIIGPLNFEKYLTTLKKKLIIHDIKLIFNDDLESIIFETDLEEELSINSALGKILTTVTFLDMEFHFKKRSKTNLTETVYLEIPKTFRTVLHQYLLFFADFTEKAKKTRIDLTIIQNKTGLELYFPDNIEQNIIIEYFNEYLAFAKSGVENINPKIENDLNKLQKDLLITELKGQLRSLTTQLEIKNVENKLFKESIERLNGIAIKQAESKLPIQITTNNQSSSIAFSESNAIINFDFSLELNQLQNEFSEFKNELFSHLTESQKDELNKIDDELLEIDESEQNPKNINKKGFKRLRRLIEAINNPDSGWNKALKATEKVVGYTKKLTEYYNKIAPYLNLGVIENIFPSV